MLYLTPNSIGYVAQGMMALAISVYLATRRPVSAGSERQAHYLLTAQYGALTLFVLTQLLDSALDQSSRLVFAYGQNTAATLVLLLTLQFAYRFPVAWRTRREPQLVLGLSLGYLLVEGGLAIERYLLLAQGVVRFRPEWADLPLLLGFLWLLVVALRQAARLLWGELAGAPPARGGWRLRNQAARAAVAYVLVYSFPLWLSLSNLLSSYGWLSTNTNDLLIASGTLAAIFFHVLIYLHVRPEQTPLPVRLAGVALLTILTVFGVIGWALSPAIVASYRVEPRLPTSRALRFTPTTQGGYHVETLALPALGSLGVRFEQNRLYPLPFAFPYFGSSYRSIFIYEDGIASFGRPAELLNLRWRYGTDPAIAPLFMDLDTPPEGGIFITTSAEHYRITWHRLYSRYDPARRYSFALELWPSGAFTLIYYATPAETIFAPYDDAEMVRFSGVLAGDGRPPVAVDLVRDPPFASAPGQGMVTSYYGAFRTALNRLLLPLAMVLIASSLLLLFGIPLFISFTVTRPLEALLEGVRRIERGLQADEVAIFQADEIGSLARSFNAMSRAVQHAEGDLQAYREHLEELVQQRTAELDEARVQAEAASRTKSTFLTTMSHELRTPLTAIIGLSETLAHQPQLTAEQRQDLHTIEQSGVYLLALINDVLDMARLETGRVTLRPQAFDLLHLLDDVQALVRPQAQRKGLTLRHAFDSDLPRFLHSDGLKIRQVLINLLTNAIKFTHQGEVLFTVERLADGAVIASDVPLSPVGLHFQVGDTGIGIAPDIIAQIFEPFVQAGGQEVVREGTGLGLSISQQLVRLLGGELLVESQLGQGSRFRFTLYLMETTAMESLLRASSPAQVSQDPPDLQARVGEQWRSCPLEWQVALSQAVRLGDFVEAAQLVVTLHRSAPELATYLTDFIARFDQVGLVVFIDAHRQDTPSED